jgi:hypothetical protein
VLLVLLVAVSGLWVTGWAPWRSAAPASDPGAYDGVQVVGIRWSITYENGTVGSLGPADSSLCNGCPLRLAASASFSVTWSLTDGQPSGFRNVTAIVPGDGFALRSTNPSLPSAIGAGRSAAIVVGLQAPASIGDYVLYLNATVD